ncbi:hypothetical protein PsorP6_013808 [Peronosclerospora sorghi]|uniref:Uncharacterized protein n=1 Tax=Peronosclerospora sorghi TaxID=230839 RepID=A0ACC0VFI2_9STRA|nr:hypothetical protein PsorP6_013808 [Peronosclerospora sorghi]
MLRKLSERFPVAATRLEAYTGSTNSDTKTASPSTDTEITPSPSSSHESGSQAAPNSPVLFGEEDVSAHKSDDPQPPTLTSTLTERFNSESVSAAAASMMSFMKKAQAVATTAAKEGAVKARKALDVADMDALQRRLSYALDRSTGDVNLDLLNFSYVTENIVAMGFPNMNMGTNRTLLKDNPIDLVATYLNGKHDGHYMIWNLSEETYDVSYFDNQVLEFKFPGHPAPPLGLMFKICSSIESWLQADDKNLAAVHCLTGKGRTGSVIACYLAWVGQFSNAMESLEFVAEKRQTSVEKLTIPSQRRYIQYFNNVMEGVKPRSSPLLLRRVIINTVPVFGQRRVLEHVNDASKGDRSEAYAAVGEPLVSSTAVDKAKDEDLAEKVEEGCSPYLQIFKGGKLVFTTTWRDMRDGDGVQWASTRDGSVSFKIDCMLQGDILLRCRHLTDAGKRISMFRSAFHTGYVPQGVLRLTKAQLDGACNDPRFDQDFFVDLIFADVETEGIPSADTGSAEPNNAPKSEGLSLNEEDRQAYEDMLHRDEAFWQDIEDRKKRLQKQREKQLEKKKAEAEAQAAAVAAAELEAKAEAVRKEQTNQRPNSFSITGTNVDHVSSVNAIRKDSWNEEKDKELMNELESLTSGSLAKAAADVNRTELEVDATTDLNVPGRTDDSTDILEEFDEIKSLEKELGLQLEGVPDVKIDPKLELLDAELKGLEGLSPKTAGGMEDVMNFEADDFDELEEYLSGLSTK